MKGFLLARQAKEADKSTEASNSNEKGAAKEDSTDDAAEKDKDWVNVKKSDEKIIVGAIS